jgi:hypothetical protein
MKGGIKSDKRGPRQHQQRVMITASYDEEMNDKDTDDSDEELMAAAEHDFKCPALSPTNHFEKLLNTACPNHTFPIKHKLKECSMTKKLHGHGKPGQSQKS